MAKIEEYLSQSKYAEHRNVTKGYIWKVKIFFEKLDYAAPPLWKK